ncbi:hypothetical protein J7I97_32105 [Streptomyces sp. ISL-87]|uniref:hypothetical protein n=1 Tax=Streptomyces sp. ISL-87 TaxID=2819188 RepID=UPI001BEB0789|nr:hypothetical protein [Streptomyces sp. ISL-87]MBT2612741.1 hypothetical protein [Streptomyces sp. ISL-87]
MTISTVMSAAVRCALAVCLLVLVRPAVEGTGILFWCLTLGAVFIGLSGCAQLVGARELTTQLTVLSVGLLLLAGVLAVTVGVDLPF